MERARVGLIGLGAMGAGIAGNLARAEMLSAAHDLDPTAGSGAALSAFMRGSAEDVFAESDVCLFAVPSTAEIASAVADVAGLDGKLIVDLTTSSPEAGRALAAELERAGASYVDAAMTGGAAGAEAGTLTLMAGGAPADIERLQQVFGAIADRVFHLGPAGAGQTMKLVHNLILHASFMATCEGLSIARNLGLDPANAVEVLNAGNARSFVTEVRFPRDILSGAMNGRSHVGNLAKDLGLAAELARTCDAAAPYTDLTAELLRRAKARGLGGDDFTWLFPHYAALADMEEAT